MIYPPLGIASIYHVSDSVGWQGTGFTVKLKGTYHYHVRTRIPTAKPLCKHLNKKRTKLDRFELYMNIRTPRRLEFRFDVS
jgi:hypothetical protein